MMSAWMTRKRLIYAGLILVGLFVLMFAVLSLISYVRTSAYNEREAERVAEREAWAKERQALTSEREKYRIEAAEANAMAEAMAQVAEAKRTDRAAVVKELEQIETSHQQRKAELEATTSSLSDTALADELCRRMRARGYPCPE